MTLSTSLLCRWRSPLAWALKQMLLVYKWLVHGRLLEGGLLQRPLLQVLLLQGLVSVLLLVLAPPTLAIELRGDHQKIDLASALYYIEDPKQRLTLSDVKALPAQHWQLNQNPVFNAGFSTSNFWFRLELETSALHADHWLLEIANPLLDHIDIYFMRGDQILAPVSLGDSLPFSARPIDHRNFLLRIPDIKDGERLTLLIRSDTSGTMQLPIRAWQSDAFIEHEQISLMWQCIFYGIMLAMAVVNFFVFIATQIRSYLYYVGTVMSLLLFQATLHGYGYQILWPENQWWQDKSVAFFIACTSTFSMYFAISFLKLKQQKPLYYYPFALFAFLSSCGLVFSLVLPYALALRFAVTAIALGSPLCILIGALLLHHGFKPARFYLLAWTMLMGSSIILIVSKTGYLPVSTLTENIQQIGATLQAILLALALADQIQQMHREQLAAQDAQLRHEREIRESQERANTQLERRVDERTRELAEVIRKLADANERLAKMSIVDELSSLNNRRYFNQKYEADFKAAYREQIPIAVIMFDIDFFKQINDQYGHLVGDRCIAHVAGIIRDTVTRASDIVARYGGEEFVVVLCNTHAEGAWHVGEEIRKRVESTPLLWREESISLTISGGVASMIPPHYSAMMVLLDKADSALYEAKQSGRNQLVIAPKMLTMEKAKQKL